MDQYVIAHDHGKVLISSLDDPAKIDTLINVESILFLDTEYQVENSNEESLISTLYQQVLDRQADLAGFQYWATEAASGNSLGSIAMSFLYSEEKSKTVGWDFDSLSASDQIESLYVHFLGRASDEAGKAYWLEQFEAGENITSIANGFAHSLELAGVQLRPEDWDFMV